MRLTKAEVLAFTNIGEEEFRSRHRRDQNVLAFGLKELPAGEWYHPIDAVGLLLGEALAASYGGTLSAQMGRVFAADWLRVVAEGEADLMADAMFCVADLVGGDGKRCHVACNAGEMPTITTAVQTQGYHVVRVIQTSISQIVRTVRENAARIGLDLTAPFVPLPDTPEFAAIVSAFGELDHGVVEAAALRKRDARARRAGERARVLLTAGRLAAAA